jgi:hypothetical protein
MAHIYSSAYATLVQQSGHDANGGLPGVQPNSRSGMAMTGIKPWFNMQSPPIIPVTELAPALISPAKNQLQTIENQLATSDVSAKSELNIDLLVEAIDKDSEISLSSLPIFQIPQSLRSSYHSTRGWTLQETLLSLRCVYFFDKHLTVVCEKHVVQDFEFETAGLTKQFKERQGVTIDKPYSTFDAAFDVVPWRMNPLKPFKSGTPAQQSWLDYFETYARIVSDYTSRKLTFDSDILAAFRGLELEMSKVLGSKFTLGLPTISFQLALLWIPASYISRRHQGYTEVQGGQLPTWTWAGWNGNVTYNLCPTSGAPSRSTPYLGSYITKYQICGFPEHDWSISKSEATFSSIRASGLLKLYRDKNQTTHDPIKQITYPVGCLHFWSEEAVPEQITWRITTVDDAYYPDSGSRVLHEADTTRPTSSQAVLLYQSGSDVSFGIVAIISGESLESLDEYSFVLLSETDSAHTWWPEMADGQLRGYKKASIFQYTDQWTADSRFSYFLNVMLIRRKGHFAERVGIGQLQLRPWMEMKRRRRYFRIV